jgi:iron complex transport system substrate-binding protein
VSAFIDANFEKIIALEPDLVIGFSDLQAEIAKTIDLKGITFGLTITEPLKAFSP